MLFSLNLNGLVLISVYGTHLPLNNNSMKNALSELKRVLSSALADRCDCSSLLGDMEGTINRIEEKLSAALTEDFSLADENARQLNFAVETDVATNYAASPSANI